MRILATTFATLLTATPVLAAPLEPFTGGGSVSVISCEGCPALKAPPKGESYHVEAIEPGTQKIEIREENGERRIYRTEAWMGGSPVTFVSKAPAEAPADGVKIDANAHTGALGIDAAATAEAASMTVTATGSREFDASGFALRVN